MAESDQLIACCKLRTNNSITRKSNVFQPVSRDSFNIVKTYRRKLGLFPFTIVNLFMLLVSV